MRQLSTLHRGQTRDQIWDVCIVDNNDEDAPYIEAWRQRYGCRWPITADYRMHPVLRNLLLACNNFYTNVIYHGIDREREIMWARFPDARPAGHDDD